MAFLTLLLKILHWPCWKQLWGPNQHFLPAQSDHQALPIPFSCSVTSTAFVSQSDTKKPHRYDKAQQSPALPVPGLKCREQGGDLVLTCCRCWHLRWHLLRWHRVTPGLGPAQGSASQLSSLNRGESPASPLKYGFASPAEKGSAPLETQQMVDKYSFIQGFALFTLWQMPDNSTELLNRCVKVLQTAPTCSTLPSCHTRHVFAGSDSHSVLPTLFHNFFPV